MLHTCGLSTCVTHLWTEYMCYTLVSTAEADASDAVKNASSDADDKDSGFNPPSPAR